MFKSILWATDGSESADRALPFVKSIARESEAAVVVFHVDQRIAGRAGGQPMIANEDDMRVKIDGQAHELGDAGINARVQVVNSVTTGPAHEIAQAAEELPADLIIVGTRGHTSLSGLLLGSVTHRLLHISPCPVFTVPAGATEEKSVATRVREHVAMPRRNPN
jgi:nucleotide-binding universal stress UspA family protein